MAKARKADLDILVGGFQRISLRDCLVVPELVQPFVANLARYSHTSAEDGAALEVASREALHLAYGYEDCSENRKPYVYNDGNAVIPIHGTLLNRFNSSWGFVTGYNYVRRMLNLALDDDDVERIVFDVDSPGGEAAGCFELAREILASRRVKPSVAVVDSVSASGGYALPCCATKIYAIPSARVGSIGVYRMHVSYEGALKDAGIKVTFAQAGDHKTDGNPYKDLPQSVLDDWRESAGKVWDDFISLVSDARGISDAAVRDTQARVYRADEALDKGLIDAVKTTTEAVSAFVAELADDDPSNQDDEEAMTDKPKEVTSGLSAADLQTIGTMIATSVGGAIAGLTRSQSIKDYGASKGKAFVALAATLASDENISLEQAKVIIDAAVGAVPSTPPKKKKGGRVESDGPENEDDDGEGDDDDGEEAGDVAARRRRQRQDNANHFNNAMNNSDHPKVGAGGKGKDPNAAPTDEEKADMLIADYASTTGVDFKKSKAA